MVQIKLLSREFKVPHTLSMKTNTGLTATTLPSYVSVCYIVLQVFKFSVSLLRQYRAELR